MDLVHTVVHGPGSPCSVYVCFHDVCLCHKTNILPVLVPFDQYNTPELHQKLWALPVPAKSGVNL